MCDGHTTLEEPETEIDGGLMRFFAEDATSPRVESFDQDQSARNSFAELAERIPVTTKSSLARSVKLDAEVPIS